MRSGHYTADDRSTIDQMARAIHDSAKVRDAIKRGKTGCALLFDAEGKMEVVNLGESEINVRSATKQEAELGWLKSYENMGEGAFKEAAAESHKVAEKSAGKFLPQVSLGAGDAATADAARLVAERKAKQEKLTADARVFNRSQFERNEKYAADAKAHASRMWPKASNKCAGRGR